jgi:hypothetical protein
VARLPAERGISLPQPQPLPSTTIRLDPEDIAKARVQAAERGLRYHLNYAQLHCAVAAWPVERQLDEASFRFFLSLSWV